MSKVPHNMAFTPIEFHIFGPGKKKGPVIAAKASSLSVKPKVGQNISIDTVVSGKVLGLYGKTILNPDVGLAVHVQVPQQVLQNFYSSKSSWELFGRDW